RSKLVEAEAQVPAAMADAFQSGKLGIFDYYKLRNVQADTEMRKAISSSGSEAGNKTNQP
ncbi:MAG: flotillin-like FloA family protein, partial [Planctomycetota bacterium]|nr:flotillin-like FloA family protein [Planctomycetota bacterium]